MDLWVTLPARNDRFGYAAGPRTSAARCPRSRSTTTTDGTWIRSSTWGRASTLVGGYRVRSNVPAALSTPTTGVATGSRRPAAAADHDVRGPGRPRLRVGGGQLTKESRPRTRRYAGGGLVPAVADLTRQGAPQTRSRWRHVDGAFSARFGTFPYPEIDIVLSSLHSFSGMEYPTIIFTNPRPRSPDAMSSRISCGTASWETTSSRSHGSMNRSRPGRGPALSPRVGCTGYGGRAAHGRLTKTWRTGLAHQSEYGSCTARAGACWRTSPDVSGSLGSARSCTATRRVAGWAWARTGGLPGRDRDGGEADLPRGTSPPSGTAGAWAGWGAPAAPAGGQNGGSAGRRRPPQKREAQGPLAKVRRDGTGEDPAVRGVFAARAADVAGG